MISNSSVTMFFGLSYHKTSMDRPLPIIDNPFSYYGTGVGMTDNEINHIDIALAGRLRHNYVKQGYGYKRIERDIDCYNLLKKHRFEIASYTFS